MQPLSKDEVDRIVDNNLVEEFSKLAATPGFVLTPMPFHQVMRCLCIVYEWQCRIKISRKSDDLHHRYKNLQVRAACSHLVSLDGIRSISGHTEASELRHDMMTYKSAHCV